MAVITVLDGARTLEDVVAKRRKAGMALAGERVDNEIEAFVSPDLADRLLGGTSAAPGQALAAAQAEADKPDFTPHLIGTTASLEATSTETRVRTHNLIGRIPGRDPDAGAVLLVAHWDHFGVCADGGAICPGAVDNASGVAVITEVARQILAAGRCARPIATSMSWPPRRRKWACWARWPLPRIRRCRWAGSWRRSMWTAPGWCRRVVRWRSSAGA
jgi:hypothetical protein